MESTTDKQPDSEDEDVFWCSRDIKNTPDIKLRLENRIRECHRISGYSLHSADLSHINLVKRGSKDGYVMTRCDFYRANLAHAHLFNIDLSNSSLMKANLSHANLHRANLENCNLLGARFTGAKLENVKWGKKLYQEHCAEEAAKSGNVKEQFDNIEQAEEIYRSLRLETEKQGLFETAGHFFRKEMVMRRMRFPLFSWQRFISKLVDLFCGYGEKPANVVIFSLLVILFSATVYFAVGINYASESLRISFNASLIENIYNFLSCLYFSVVTFTTLGYGELTPIGFTRAMAALEAFIGSFTMALFVVVFVKKMTR